MHLKENGLEIIKRPISNAPVNDKDYIKVGGSLEETQKNLENFQIMMQMFFLNIIDVLKMLQMF